MLMVPIAVICGMYELIP